MSAEPYILALAESLYTQAGTPQGPPWRQLGDATQSLWIERARVEMQTLLGGPVALAIDKEQS